jgi:hypothetical protein
MSPRWRLGTMIIVGLWLGWAIGGAPALGQGVFTQLVFPDGVTTDAGGNVFVHHDTGLQWQVTKFTANGTPLGTLPIGGFSDVTFSGRLVTEPGSGLLLDLLQPGILLVIRPDTLQIVGGLDLRFVAPDANAVFDVAVRTVRNFSGFILPGQIAYGDLVVLRRGGQIDFFITGVSVVTAFVMRLRLLPDGTLLGPKVLVASSLTTAGTVNQPRGVAVNANGIVLTTLPAIAVPTAGALDSLIGFIADLEPTPGAPFPGFVGNFDFTSFGMTTDTAGNFYIASGPVGTSVCGPAGSGALVFITAALDTASCLTFGAILADARDVAVSPARDRVYMTLGAHNQVLVFPLQ